VGRTTPGIEQAAYTVRGMIAEGTLGPGDKAPSAPELREATGVCVVYCGRALGLLVEDGTRAPGKPPRGRPRVPGSAPTSTSS
jgi:DNA-binding GntR family transcriptional regulator